MSIASMHQILDNLWLGDMAGAYNKFQLKKNGITHILTVAMGIMPKFPTLFQYKVISILDCPSANLKVHFQPCLKFLKESMYANSIYDDKISILIEARYVVKIIGDLIHAIEQISRKNNRYHSLDTREKDNQKKEVYDDRLLEEEVVGEWCPIGTFALDDDR